MKSCMLATAPKINTRAIDQSLFDSDFDSDDWNFCGHLNLTFSKYIAPGLKFDTNKPCKNKNDINSYNVTLGLIGYLILWHLLYTFI